jgi:Ca2+:H+ antiporter
MTTTAPPQPWYRRFRPEPLHWLLLALPVAVALWAAGAPGLWVFAASALAIVPLAGLMGRATENLAETLGAGLGGLLNATFGNAAELILALAALARARARPESLTQMHTLVHASLTGSIIGNILLVLGMAILAGGLYHRRQEFNRTAAGMGTTLLALASIGLLIPSIYFYLAGTRAGGPGHLALLSQQIAGVLFVVYLLSLVFSLGTHQHLFAGPEERLPTTVRRRPEWGRRTSLLVLLVSTAGVAVMSELLVGSVEPAAEALGLGSVFIGVIVVAVVGNAAEHSTAVLMAVRNKMDLAFHIAVGSSLQIALFVAPVLVFASLAMGQAPPLDLHFTPLELVAVIASIGVLALVSQDGESHWMEGVMLLAVYLIFALAFYHFPQM